MTTVTDLELVRFDIKPVVEDDRQHEGGVMVSKATGLFQQQNYFVFGVQQTPFFLHATADNAQLTLVFLCLWFISKNS